MNEAQVARHQRKIVAQFDAQAKSFAKVPGHLTGIADLIELSGAEASSEVLDVACGPGLLACEFAKTAKCVTGADISKEMLAKAEERARSLRLENLRWIASDAYALPFPQESFDVVATRYSLHHMLEPEKLVGEMLRACRKGGRILVCDVAIAKEACAAYDALELLRDDSHVHALSDEEFAKLAARPGLEDVETIEFDVEIELETQIKASRFKRSQDIEEFRRRILSEAGDGKLGVGASFENGVCVYSIPIKAFSAQKA